MDDQACPRCKTTKYRNPSLKLMVNVCGHCLCESCVDLLFLKGSGSCPECGIPLRRSNFRVQMFEDGMVEREVDIRRGILRIYNKHEEDFSDLRSYNDYLEDIENIVHNLVNNVDVASTNKQIEQYKRDNQEQIARSKARPSIMELELEKIIDEEQQQEVERKKVISDEEKQEKRAKLKNKEALIDELMFSNADAKSIVSNHAIVVQKEREEATKIQRPDVPTQFSTGIKMGQQTVFGSIPKIEDGPLYKYMSVKLELLGPTPPSPNGLKHNGFLNHMRSANVDETAGGYVATIACTRAINDALSGLYYVPEVNLKGKELSESEMKMDVS